MGPETVRLVGLAELLEANRPTAKNTPVRTTLGVLAERVGVVVQLAVVVGVAAGIEGRTLGSVALPSSDPLTR
jgi:hypothetical protein